MGSIPSIPTKICFKCKRNLELNYYSKNRAKKDGHSGYCKECKAYYQNSWYLKNKVTHVKNTGVRNKRIRNEIRQFLIWLKDNIPCTDCGVGYSWYVMHFDHIRGKKSWNISFAGTLAVSVEALQEEILKCDLVCANCHAERTHKHRKGS